MLYNSFFVRLVLLVFASSILLSAVGKAQNPYEGFLVSDTKDTTDLKHYFELNNLNFFKNYEAFNKFSEGYTYPGMFADALFNLAIADNLKISAGIYSLLFFGDKGFSKFKPVYSVHWQASKKFSAQIGSIQSPVKTGMSDLLYHHELYLTDKHNNGLQFDYQGKIFSSRTWIDWEVFIFKNSPYPEKFILGSTNDFILWNTDKHRLLTKFEFTASHIGGQIDTSGVSVSTIANAHGGFEYVRMWNESSAKVFAYYAPALDASPNRQLVYSSGHGILSGVQADFKQFKVGLQHWYSERWFSSHGNPIFSNISRLYDDHAETQRSLLIPHIIKGFEISENTVAAISADAYYDIFNQNLSYSFGFYVKVNLFVPVFPEYRL